MLLVTALRLEMWAGQFTSGPGLLNSSLFTFWEAESSNAVQWLQALAGLVPLICWEEGDRKAALALSLRVPVLSGPYQCPSCSSSDVTFMSSWGRFMAVSPKVLDCEAAECCPFPTRLVLPPPPPIPPCRGHPGSLLC